MLEEILILTIIIKNGILKSAKKGGAVISNNSEEGSYRYVRKLRKGECSCECGGCGGGDCCSKK